MVDFHSHILPEMDDGSRSVEESLAMLAMYGERVTDLVLTPHFYARRDTPDAFFERREQSLSKLLPALEGKKHPRLHFGAEVAYFDGIHNCEDVQRFCISDSRLLLVEMPFCDWNHRMIDELVSLYRDRGIRPVLAHIDRYGYGGGANRALFEEYLQNCGLVQINAEAVLGFFSCRRVIPMLRDGKIHFIGSDAHNTAERKPNLDAALDRLEKVGADFALNRFEMNFDRFFDC